MLILIIGILFHSLASKAIDQPIPHLDLQMSGSEYHTLLNQRDDIDFDDELEPVIRMGKRYFDWLKLVNSQRPEDKKLSLSDPETQPAYPIDQPKISSPKIILSLFEKLKTDLPTQMKEQIFSYTQPTENPLVSDDEFVVYGKRIDSVYGMASRWVLQKPYLWGYASKKHSDIRGFYFLTKVPNIKEELDRWNQLDQEKQKQYSEWLEGLCYNGNETTSYCQAELQKVVKEKGTARPFYETYLGAGQARWNELFRIENKRSDIVWSQAESDLLKTPFVKPQSVEVENFLKENIEDEWRWNSWKLNLDFISGNYDTTHIEFVPGATPHVNGLAGSTITMDANQPLSEYHVRWTIRHEFGHTLGFPDCYVEFYEADKGIMISYQVDITNLMCSRRGKLQAKHFEELKRVYLNR